MDVEDADRGPEQRPPGSRRLGLIQALRRLVAGELSAKPGTGYADYTAHARRLAALDRAEEMPQAVRHLVRLGEQSVPGFVERLESPDAVVRLQAAWALGQIGSQSAVEPLVEALRDPEPNVRFEGAEALAAIGPAAVLALIAGTTCAEGDARAAACYALGRLGVPAALAALVARLADEDELTRVQATWALGELRQAEAVAAVEGVLADPSAAVRRAAALALARIGTDEAMQAIEERPDAAALVRQAASEGELDLAPDWPPR